MKRFLIGMATIAAGLALARAAEANPDLVVTRVHSRDTAAQGHDASAEITVKNQGHARSLTSCRLRVEVWRRNFLLATRYVYVPALAAGAEFRVQVSTTPHIHPRYVLVRIDDLGWVAETDENNNEVRKDIP